MSTKRFDYNDINLIPRYSKVNSRSECDTTVQFGKFTFKNPVIPANMESVINEDLAKKLAKSNYFYIMHRFNINIKEFIINMKKENLITSISIGVNDDSYQLINELIEENLLPDYITIDIAHGHCLKMKNMLSFLKSKINDVFIIAGNVSTTDATEDLCVWGADAVKVGIGPGCFINNSVIKTKNGLKKIQDILVGDEVLTHKNRYKEVVSITSYMEEDDLIEVNGEISTLEHEYYVIDIKFQNEINEDNYKKYAKWIKAIDLDENIHLLLEL